MTVTYVKSSSRSDDSCWVLRMLIDGLECRQHIQAHFETCCELCYQGGWLPVFSQNSINVFECPSYNSRVLAGILALQKPMEMPKTRLYIMLFWS